MMVNWLLTYWPHSSVLLGLTWMFVRQIRTLDAAAVEILWRIALYPELLTSDLL